MRGVTSRQPMGKLDGRGVLMKVSRSNLGSSVNQPPFPRGQGAGLAHLKTERGKKEGGESVHCVHSNQAYHHWVNYTGELIQGSLQSSMSEQEY